MYITMSFRSKLWCHNAAKEGTFYFWSLRKPKGQGCWLQPTKDCVTYLNDVSSLKVVELKKNFADPMELMRLIRKRLNFPMLFWNWQPLVMQSQNLKF